MSEADKRVHGNLSRHPVVVVCSPPAPYLKRKSTNLVALAAANPKGKVALVLLMGLGNGPLEAPLAAIVEALDPIITKVISAYMQLLNVQGADRLLLDARSALANGKPFDQVVASLNTASPLGRDVAKAVKSPTDVKLAWAYLHLLNVVLRVKAQQSGVLV